MLDRTDWDNLDATVRALIEARTGPVLSARTAQGGQNSQLAAILETAAGRLFVKGIRKDERQAVSQAREAAVASAVQDVSPRLLWRAEEAGWDLLAFEHTPGRHADYNPGSADISHVIETMDRLASITIDPHPQVKEAAERWRHHIPDPSILNGDQLLHTDWAPDNLLITGDRRAVLIDWAWPTRGAPWIDPACLVVRLCAAGHDPATAEEHVTRLPAWSDAPAAGLTAFARALADLWAEITEADPTDWKQAMAAAADNWASSR